MPKARSFAVSIARFSRGVPHRADRVFRQAQPAAMPGPFQAVQGIFAPALYTPPGSCKIAPNRSVRPPTSSHPAIPAGSAPAAGRPAPRHTACPAGRCRFSAPARAGHTIQLARRHTAPGQAASTRRSASSLWRPYVHRRKGRGLRQRARQLRAVIHLVRAERHQLCAHPGAGRGQRLRRAQVHRLAFLRVRLAVARVRQGSRVHHKGGPPGPGDTAQFPRRQTNPAPPCRASAVHTSPGQRAGQPPAHKPGGAGDQQFFHPVPPRGARRSLPDSDVRHQHPARTGPAQAGGRASARGTPRSGRLSPPPLPQRRYQPPRRWAGPTPA